MRKVPALAVSSGQRVEIAPELPTVAESGVPGFESIVWYPIFAPAGTPHDINALAGGEVQMTFNVITGTLPQARAGRIRALAVRRNDSQRSCITKNRGFSLRVKRRLLSTRSPGSLFSIGERVYITPVMRQGSNSSQPLLL